MSGAHGADQVVFWGVVVARLLVPLLVFKFPLPGIVAAMLLDGVDQTVFQTFTSMDLSGYQSYDKALDVYYLSLAYLATMRNWTSPAAYRVARFLFFYRLAGTAVFELTGGEHRILLLVFANTFEYFFIAYEAIRLRWDPARFTHRDWVLLAAAIWVVVKVPQETWIHVLELDLTDMMGEHAWFTPAFVVVIGVVAAGAVAVLRPRLGPVDHGWQLAATKVPGAIDDARARAAFRVAQGTVFDRWLLEKIAIVSLVSVIFANILPTVQAHPLRIATSCAALIIINSAIGLHSARRGGRIESVLLTFLAEAGLNIALVVAAALILRPSERFFLTSGFFFIFLLTLVVTLYDRYRPILDIRAAGDLRPVAT